MHFGNYLLSIIAIFMQQASIFSGKLSRPSHLCMTHVLLWFPVILLSISTIKCIDLAKVMAISLTLVEEPFTLLLSIFSIRRLANNPIKCTCKLQSDLSDESIKRKISDLNLIRCSNLNKSVEEAIRDVNCGMSISHFVTILVNSHLPS